MPYLPDQIDRQGHRADGFGGELERHPLLPFREDGLEKSHVKRDVIVADVHTGGGLAVLRGPAEGGEARADRLDIEHPAKRPVLEGFTTRRSETGHRLYQDDHEGDGVAAGRACAWKSRRGIIHGGGRGRASNRRSPRVGQKDGR